MNVQVCLLIVYKLVSSAACPDDTSIFYPHLSQKGSALFSAAGNHAGSRGAVLYYSVLFCQLRDLFNRIGQLRNCCSKA
jgi:hypothetical protein